MRKEFMNGERNVKRKRIRDDGREKWPRIKHRNWSGNGSPIVARKRYSPPPLTSDRFRTLPAAHVVNRKTFRIRQTIHISKCSYGVFVRRTDFYQNIANRRPKPQYGRKRLTRSRIFVFVFYPLKSGLCVLHLFAFYQRKWPLYIDSPPHVSKVFLRYSARFVC